LKGEVLLLGLRLQQFDGPLDLRGEIEILRLELDGSHLQLRETEHRVEDLLQAGAALTDELSETDVVLFDLLFEHLRESDHAREGRPNFVAHVGEKGRLEPIGLLGLFAGPFGLPPGGLGGVARLHEVGLAGLPLRNVPGRQDDPAPPVGAFELFSDRLHPEVPPTLGPNPKLGTRSTALFERLPDRLQTVVSILGVDEVEGPLARDLFGVKAKEVFNRRRNVEKPGGGIEVRHDVGHVLGEEAILLLLPAKLSLGLFAGADVLPHPDEPVRAPKVDPDAGEQHRNRRTVRPHELGLDGGRTAGEGPRDGHDDVLPILSLEKAIEATSVEVAGPVPGLVGKTSVPVLDRPALIEHKEDGRQQVQRSVRELRGQEPLYATTGPPDAQVDRRGAQHGHDGEPGRNPQRNGRCQHARYNRGPKPPDELGGNLGLGNDVAGLGGGKHSGLVAWGRAATDEKRCGPGGGTPPGTENSPMYTGRRVSRSDVGDCPQCMGKNEARSPPNGIQ